MRINFFSLNADHLGLKCYPILTWWLLERQWWCVRYNLRLAGRNNFLIFLFSVGISEVSLRWWFGKLKCNAVWRDGWKFSLLFKGHWQSRGTALGAGKLPVVWVVQGDCERVLSGELTLCNQQGNEDLQQLPWISWHNDAQHSHLKQPIGANHPMVSISDISDDRIGGTTGPLLWRENDWYLAVDR